MRQILSTIDTSLYKIPSYAGCAIGCAVILLLIIMVIIRAIPHKPKKPEEGESSGSGLNINDRDVELGEAHGNDTESAQIDLYANPAGQNEDPPIKGRIDARPKDLSSDDEI
ncbi:hypothetical protein TVAG_011020 [Trichomonas vaginalis G3]|uniref:Uncharacterized protein n=1 Tax=Trichomonas vaginalis (strain ATCC PRA-98 / G3) TaxID=412133 RepID=A2DP28_TRIV3|nr:hypothetical protein TVAGG3_0989280 [Trichomonas vaginalis G3]EAY17877.1 hypothetical protein TVAG_011020 [Trichomonas vaginalis G3]KAI5489905.1 hypothetical protein TVAGG3_0989280 [Trichomonas vaginalis G3]|eukprot:XP_001330012.1 hypothetical protein [Trichomonas vaginalis G3]